MTTEIKWTSGISGSSMDLHLAAGDSTRTIAAFDLCAHTHNAADGSPQFHWFFRMPRGSDKPNVSGYAASPLVARNTIQLLTIEHYGVSV